MPRQRLPQATRPVAQPVPLPGPTCPGPGLPYLLEPHPRQKVAPKRPLRRWNSVLPASWGVRQTGCRRSCGRPGTQNPLHGAQSRLGQDWLDQGQLDQRRTDLEVQMPASPPPEPGADLTPRRGRSRLHCGLIWLSSASFVGRQSLPARSGRKGWPQSPAGVTLTYGMPRWPVSGQICSEFARGALNSAVECHLHTVEVAGSNPAAPTINQ